MIPDLPPTEYVVNVDKSNIFTLDSIQLLPSLQNVTNEHWIVRADIYHIPTKVWISKIIIYFDRNDGCVDDLKIPISEVRSVDFYVDLHEYLESLVEILLPLKYSDIQKIWREQDERIFNREMA